MSKGFSMFMSFFEESGAIPWYLRSNPQFSARRLLSGQEITTVNEAIEADPVAVYCALLPELLKRKINIDATFSCCIQPDSSECAFIVNNHGQVPVAIREKIPYPKREFSREEYELCREMIAASPHTAISDAVSHLKKKGLIISSWYLAGKDV